MTCLTRHSKPDPFATHLRDRCAGEWLRKLRSRAVPWIWTFILIGLWTRGVALDAWSQAADSNRDALFRLTDEVRRKGWIVFSGTTDRGDWDLFRMRPDGTERQKLVDMPEYNEGGARFSPDGGKMLFYRLPKSDELQNNEYGTGELVIARFDGSQPMVLGRDYPWASWSSDGRQLACLTPKGILIVDSDSRQVIWRLPRQGIVSQLAWSPDGRWFTGTADHLGPFWNIARMNAETGEIGALSETDRYNCTPDWVADSVRIVYARGIVPQVGGWAELWVANLDGQPPQPLYAEEGRHIYGACASPDLKHLLFTRSVADLTRVDHRDTTMAIIRWADTPMRGDDGSDLRRRLPKAPTGPRLDLGPGWEPHWTSIDLGQSVPISMIRSKPPVSVRP
ncbi:MAG TPA: hypothetical protein PK256_13480 [Verrucomicrobiota bacterium]|nr:hypothetical protein [Verrucomicrobiota bacterium]